MVMMPTNLSLSQRRCPVLRANVRLAPIVLLFLLLTGLQLTAHAGQQIVGLPATLVFRGHLTE